MTPLGRLCVLNQAPWLDSISRAWIEDGSLQRMRDEYSLRGVTSNPSIFEAALKSDEYTETIRELAGQGKSDREIFHALAIEDIRNACDIFAVVHEATGDGFVSMEVDPDLAHDTEATIEQAKWLAEQINRPNLMIKIPATEAGIPAIEAVLEAGISVNVTLLFDTAVAARVREAWLSALTKRMDDGKPVSNIHSVASFFVSRVDSKVDALIDAAENADTNRDLRGTAAVANAAVAWGDAQNIREDSRWHRLEAAGAKPQRLLWASTGTKDASYSPVKYVTELIAPETVNTMPLATIEALSAYEGELDVTLDMERVTRARRELDRLADSGIDMNQVTNELRDEGVAAFTGSMEQLLSSIKASRS